LLQKVGFPDGHRAEKRALAGADDDLGAFDADQRDAVAGVDAHGQAGRRVGHFRPALQENLLGKLFRAEGSEIDLQSSVGALLDLRTKPRGGRRLPGESESQVGLG
jgi:hypothetical protein